MTAVNPAYVLARCRARVARRRYIAAMVLVLALCLEVTALPAATVSRLRLLDDDARSLHVAQALVEPDRAEVQRRIDELNAQIRATHTEWPGGAIALAVVGFSVSLLILPGLPLTIFGAVAGPSGLFGLGAVFLLIGAGVLTLGVVGLAAGIAGIAIGRHASDAAKAKRRRLIDERDALQRQRDGPVPPPGVWRPPGPPAMVTLAAF